MAMPMAMQAGVSTSSKVLIIVGAGLTSSVILRSGRLSDVIAQLQELLKGVNEAEISPNTPHTAILSAQIRQLAQEIRELTISRPVTIFNENSASSGSFASYIMPAAALGAMGYCYVWWKGWSFSDLMFVTKHNMANAVATVSKQLEHVSEALASTKKHLTKKLETLDWKVEEQKELSNLIANDVNEVKSNLSQIGLDFEIIHQMVSGLEGKVDILESKQDLTNSGILHLCQIAQGFKQGQNPELLQVDSSKVQELPALSYEDKSLQGLKFIVETNDASTMEKSMISTKNHDIDENFVAKRVPLVTRMHRSYPGIAVTRGLVL